MPILEPGGPAARHGSMPAEIQAVILAAGRGSRLGEFTDAAPKCLLKLGGRSLIEHQLELFSAVGVATVFVVTGYQSKKVQDVVEKRATCILNRTWSKTNSLYSFSLSRPYIDLERPLLVTNCDVLLHPLALQRMLCTPGNTFAYDSSSGDDDEHMKVELRHGRLTAMNKALPAWRTDGENVGILYFEPPAVRMLYKAADDILATGNQKLWLAAATERVAQSYPVQGIDVSDLPWVEIDFPEDFGLAKERLGELKGEPRQSHLQQPTA